MIPSVSAQVNFAYKEAGAQKQALVKVRVCSAHALELNYRKTREAIRRPAHKKRRRSDSPVPEGGEGAGLPSGPEGNPSDGEGGTARAEGIPAQHSQAPIGEEGKGDVGAAEGDREGEDDEMLREMML